MESTRDFLLKCPANLRLRLKHLGGHNFGEHGEVAGTDIIHFNKYVVSLKHLLYL